MEKQSRSLVYLGNWRSGSANRDRWRGEWITVQPSDRLSLSIKGNLRWRGEGGKEWNTGHSRISAGGEID